MTNKIVYSNIESPLGDMIAGATDKGICFLEWHDRGGVERILSRVEKRYRKPLEENVSEHLLKLQNELNDYFGGTLTGFEVPIDVNGTEFEKTVWSNLLNIPYAETRSYGEIALELGKPGASRAVGRANGKLRGYGGGLKRKKYLLDLELRNFNRRNSMNSMVSHKM